jgi:hypothetical protein
MEDDMRPFQTKEEFVKILSALWDEIFKTPEITRKVSAEKLVVKFRFTDFETDLFIDNRGDPPKYFWDPREDVAFDVEMIQSSETSHQFWMQKLSVPMAIATRKVIAKGSVSKALKLIPALKPAFDLYPIILERLGREDLLQKIPAQKTDRLPPRCTSRISHGNRRDPTGTRAKTKTCGGKDGFRSRPAQGHVYHPGI